MCLQFSSSGQVQEALRDTCLESSQQSTVTSYGEGELPRTWAGRACARVGHLAPDDFVFPVKLLALGARAVPKPLLA